MSTSACQYLESLHRFDLALLLSASEAGLQEVKGQGWLEEIEERVVVRAPSPIADALKSLPPHDRKRIAEAVISGCAATTSHGDIMVETVHGTVSGPLLVLSELLIHRAMMVSVATGGDRIQDVNDHYIAREARLRAIVPSDPPYENPHSDLWAWYHHWREHFEHYADRRQYVRLLFEPAIAGISTRSTMLTPPREPTGWERVNRTLAKARSQLALASAEEDFQAIGLLCREIIISLAQAVYDPEIHEPVDGVMPSATDANRMLEAYIGHAFPGNSYKEVRAHARASLALALNLQHRRTATRQLAALCAEAAASTTSVISIIARTPEGG